MASCKCHNRFDCLVMLGSGFRPATLTLALSELTEFHCFQNDADVRLATINALSSHHAWPENLKWVMAINHLHGAAEAWHKYIGVRQRSLVEWSGRLFSATSRIAVITYPSMLEGTREENHHDTSALPCITQSCLGKLTREGHYPDSAAGACANQPSFRHRARKGQHLDCLSVSQSISFANSLSLANLPFAECS